VILVACFTPGHAASSCQPVFGREPLPLVSSDTPNSSVADQQPVLSFPTYLSGPQNTTPSGNAATFRAGTSSSWTLFAVSLAAGDSGTDCLIAWSMRLSSEIWHGRHRVFQLHTHWVFVTKYRKRYLTLKLSTGSELSSRKLVATSEPIGRDAWRGRPRTLARELSAETLGLVVGEQSQRYFQ